MSESPEFTIELIPTGVRDFKIHAISLKAHGGIEKIEFDKILDFAIEKTRLLHKEIREYQKNAKLMEVLYHGKRYYTIGLGITDTLAQSALIKYNTMTEKFLETDTNSHFLSSKSITAI